MAETGHKPAAKAPAKKPFDDYVLMGPILGSRVVTIDVPGHGELETLEMYNVAEKGDKLPAKLADKAEEYARESIIVPKNYYDQLNNPEVDQFMRSTSLTEHEARANLELAGYNKSQLREIEEASQEAEKMKSPVPATKVSAGMDE